MPIPAYSTYTRRQAPGAYDAGWLNAEFQNIQRALLPTTVRVVTASGPIRVTDRVVLVDASGGAVAVTLPDPERAAGLVVSIVKTDNSANAVTVEGTVSGATDPTLAAQYNTMTVVADGPGATYYTLAEL